MTTERASAPLRLGQSLPDFALPATDGRRYGPNAFSEDQLLVVLFLANHCPYVGAWEDRINALATQFVGRGAAFAAISSNDAGKLPADSFEAMQERAAEKQYPFPYLYDADGSVARRFGATRTPEVFVFDRERTLRYHGAVDSDWEEGPDLEPYLNNALSALIAGRSPEPAETPPLGCSIKPKQ